MYFADAERAHKAAVKMRWPEGVTCPHCGSTRVGFIKTRQKFKCKNAECRKQFSVKVGTVMEDSPLTLDKWMVAIWMVANCKNGVSSYELHRALGITQKSAWFLLHRVRFAMQADPDEQFEGEVEVDETYIGGKARNMHYSKKKEKVVGRGTSGKTIVMGVLDRKNRKVRAKVIGNTDRKTMTEGVKKETKKGSTVYTDAHSGYDLLTEEGFIHKVIDHAVKYVDGAIHTNGIENFWSLLKRALKGTYISVQVFHLFRYIDEQTFRYDYRKHNDRSRFVTVASRLAGRRVTYKQLTGAIA